MEEINKNSTEAVDLGHAETDLISAGIGAGDSLLKHEKESQNLFPESPIYEPEEMDQDNVISISDDMATSEIPGLKDDKPAQVKRKLSDETIDSSSKLLKLDLTKDEVPVTTQTLDNEVSDIIAVSKWKIDDAVPSTSRVRTPVRSSPRKIKRSNSSDTPRPKTPRTPKTRPASVDITKARRTPSKKLDLKHIPIIEEIDLVNCGSQNSRPSVEFVREIPPLEVETIEESNSELNDSQSFHLVLSPTPDEIEEKPTESKYSSDPVLVKDRNEVISAKPIDKAHSEGYNYSDQSSNNSQPQDPKRKILEFPTDQASTDTICSIGLESPDHVSIATNKMISKLSNGNSSTPTEKINVELKDSEDKGYIYSHNILSQPLQKDFGKSTDQESTDSVCSMSLESPDHVSTVTNKLISKLSNGDSSTPSEACDGNHNDDSERTPDTVKLNLNKGKRGKNDSFRASNNTTPSTISPLQNGHSLPVNTPQIPVFDVHTSHNEDGEFLSLYIVRTDNDLGLDMCKEFQRFSKRFTIDPYMADVSVSNSPSSVTSGGLINLPNRTSFASTVSSTSTSSNRTSDGNFVVPQPPRKSVSNPSTSVKGYDALMKKLQDIFSHMREVTIDDHNRSDDKVSIGIQASSDSTVSNGNASPEEVIKSDKATPKSSLKKTRFRGRRHMAGKTKRALLPTQTEEPEYMHGMNSPEMVPINGNSEKTSPKDDKPLSSLVGTPKSVTKLKKKGRPLSPRPATPVEKAVVKTEYPGYEPGTAVLAKWVDKRYYSGQVIEITEPNKYLIKFDDGQSKVLLDDFIIFGDTKTLPLEGQSVYAMVDEEQNYEPGLVLGMEENDSGTVTYRCTTDGDTVVLVTASELYLTEDQARSLVEGASRASQASGPHTPRRAKHYQLDLDNIIQGPRSARSRDKAANSSARKRVASPKSPKASTSGLKSKSTPRQRKRLVSESSSVSESSVTAAPRLEHVAGVEPELQRTPRKLDGVKAGPLQLKGAAKQNVGKKNSKLTKFENDEDTVSLLGPIPEPNSKLFAGLHFLLTCTEPPKKSKTQEKCETRHYSSEEDGETTSGLAGTDTEDLEFSDIPFNKERLKEQLEAGGGIVHSHFDDVPKSKHSVCKLIAPRPCLTAKYISVLALGGAALSHAWVVAACRGGGAAACRGGGAAACRGGGAAACRGGGAPAAPDPDAFTLPAGWSLRQGRFITHSPSTKRNPSFFNNKLILLCGEQDTFVKFWEKICTLAGANTRVVNEEDLNMSGAIALVTEWDCPHEVQNKANQDNIPLVSTTWVIQCLIEAKCLEPTSHDKFSFMYTEPE